MFKTALYLNLSSNISKDKYISLIESRDIKDKIEGMKCIISLISQGRCCDSILYKVMKEIVSSDSNELKRLFYYFLEIYIPIMNEEELLLLTNQIHKDLSSPNEYIRGDVLKFVATLSCKNTLNILYKAIMENTTHAVGYVRRSAYFCLSEIHKKYNLFTEASEILLKSLYKEIDPLCLVQAFYALFEIDKEKALVYAYEIGNTKCKELSLLMIENISDEAFIERFVNDSNVEVRLESCLKLLDISQNNQNISRYISTIFNDIKDQDVYLNVALKKISEFKEKVDLSIYCLDVLTYINPYNIRLSRNAIRFIYETCSTKDLQQILDMITKKYKEIKNMTIKNSSMEVMILEETVSFINKHGIQNDEISNICKGNILSDNPNLAYISLNVFKAILNGNENKPIISFLVDNFYKVHYGKIFRLALEIIIKHGKQDDLKKIVDFIDSSFVEMCNSDINSNEEIIFFSSKNRHLIPIICMGLTELYFKNEACIELRNRIIALFLAFTNLKDFCNLSTKSTIFLCIKLLSKNIKPEEYSKTTKSEISQAHVCECPEIEEFEIKKHEDTFKLQNFLEAIDSVESLENVVQLTGLSDPLYVEVNVIYKRYEIILDIFLINQTDNYLQNMLFDFGSSLNIKPVIIDMPESMKARSVASRKLIFKILDSSNGFISGSVTFKYPNKSGEYANQVYTLNFSEIKIDVIDFLEERRVSSEKFKCIWKDLEWENVYSIRTVTDRDLRSILSLFSNYVKGTIIDFKEDEDILVGNISCATKQHSDILFNVCISRNEEFINLECRIRSSKEEIVKSMSGVLGRVIKEIRS